MLMFEPPLLFKFNSKVQQQKLCATASHYRYDLKKRTQSRHVSLKIKFQVRIFLSAINYFGVNPHGTLLGH